MSKLLLLIDEEQGRAFLKTLLLQGLPLEERVSNLENILGTLLMSLKPVTDQSTESSAVTNPPLVRVASPSRTTRSSRSEFHHLTPVVYVVGQKTEFHFQRLVAASLAYDAVQGDEQGLAYLVSLKNSATVEQFANSNHDGYSFLLKRGILRNQSVGEQVFSQQLHEILRNLLEFDGSKWNLRLDLVSIRWWDIGDYAMVDVLEMMKELLTLQQLQNWRYRAITSYCLHMSELGALVPHIVWFAENNMPILSRVFDDNIADLVCCLSNWGNNINQPPQVAFTYSLNSDRVY